MKLQMQPGNLHRGEEDAQHVRRGRSTYRRIVHRFLFVGQASTLFAQVQHRETRGQVHYQPWGASRGNERLRALQFPLQFLQRCHQ